MNNFKLAALFLMIVTISSTSCKKFVDPVITSTPTIQMSGALSVPPNASTATGNITGSYNDKTKTFSYTVNFNGLTGAPTAIHVHGPAAVGTPGPVIQSFTSGLGTAASGSYSNSLFVDEVLVKEVDLMAGQYYIDVHTTTYPATGTGANLRGQIVFQ